MFLLPAPVQVVDTGLATTQQLLVIGEVRTLMIWLGAHLNVLPADLVTALLAARFVDEVCGRSPSLSLFLSMSWHRYPGSWVSSLLCFLGSAYSPCVSLSFCL